MPTTTTSNHTRLIVNLVVVYLIWGSTYLAIRFAIDSIPPLLMAGVRFLVAGALLYGWVRLRGASRPTWSHWRSAIIIGGLLLVLGNGGVVVAEQTIPSGLAALLVSLVPLWIALLDWLRPGGRRPNLAVAFGLVLGFVGVALLVGPRAFGGGSAVGVVIVLVASFCWAAGSLYSRGARMPSSPLMGNAIEMLAGGILLVVVALVTGEAGKLHLSAITLRSALALAYLIIFGSLIAFTAYIWLLRNAPITRVSTYAYVNPVVAVFLGLIFAGEHLTTLTLVAAAVILAAVVVITTFRNVPSQVSLAAPAAPAASTNAPSDPELAAHAQR
ncbi:MAG: drug/metabolite exporter YedA [Ktedonobacterales bacterium]